MKAKIDNTKHNKNKLSKIKLIAENEQDQDAIKTLSKLFIEGDLKLEDMEFDWINKGDQATGRNAIIRFKKEKLIKGVKKLD